jgi:hypothetical protein
VVLYLSSSIGIPIESRIVPDNHVPISGEMHIGFNDIDSHLNCTGESFDRIFWIVMAVSTVGYHTGSGG